MIRPFTLICMVSAFGSGLYLYQSKHAAQVLDRQILRTIKQTETTRERTGMLRAEWALLNEPERLAELAKVHTTLQTLKPTQFVAMNDIAARLPAPVAANAEKLPTEAEPEEAPSIPVAQAAPTQAAPTQATPTQTASTEVSSAQPALTAAVKPREAVAEAKPKTEANPAALAEAKPAPRHVEKQLVARAEPSAPVQVAEPVSPPAQFRGRRQLPQAGMASDEATAPGTVGAAVLRAMRAQNAGSAYAQSAAEPSYPPARTYAPPAYAPPAYAQRAYTQRAYAQPTYAQPTTSVLGGGNALPPPVPFAAR